MKRGIVPLSVAPAILDAEPDLAPDHKQAILAALRWAWNELVRVAPHVLREGNEERVTFELQKLLNNRRNGERTAAPIKDFEVVTRGESQTTADGRLGKKPDLTFRPPVYASVADATRWGWFVECKIVDGGASVVAYRDEGVRRFSTGEYAASMPSGAMLAYVRDGRDPLSSLDAVLLGNVGTKRHVGGRTPDTSESEHGRGQLPQPCVDVTLCHLWLKPRADGT